MADVPPHPAKFSQPVLDRLERLTRFLRDGSVVLDPFAGVGLIHSLAGGRFDTVGVELEREWAEADPDTLVGNSRHLAQMFKPGSFHAVITSCSYGNRMADKYQGDPRGSRRVTYTIALGRPLSDDSGAALHWRPGRGGDAYRELHQAVWEQCFKVIRPGGFIFLNVSDHIRDDKVMDVVGWHRRTLEDVGFAMIGSVDVKTQRMGMGANAEKRVPNEVILIGVKAVAPVDLSEAD